MNVVVIGGGKVGYYLTKTLLEHGHHPTLVELSKSTCCFVANDLDVPLICGDGTSIEILEAANAESCDVLISVTGRDENNLISCQLAKKLFHVKKTIARVNNPKNAGVMRSLGIDITISSTDNIAYLLEREVDTANIKRLVSVNHGEGSISEITLPDNFALHGKKLSEIKLPNDCVIVSISRNNLTIIPRGDAQLQSNDIVMVMALDRAMHDIKQMLRLEE